MLVCLETRLSVVAFSCLGSASPRLYTLALTWSSFANDTLAGLSQSYNNDDEAVITH